MFLLKETSRNAYNNDRRDAVFAKNYWQHLKLRLPHPDTIDDVMRILSTDEIEVLKSEFIENIPGRDFEKQDCEQKAFVRLAAKIKKHFPRLPVCILADGLYPNNTVFEICRQYAGSLSSPSKMVV